MSPELPLGTEIRRLDASEARAHLDGLAAVLADCVDGGASVGYLSPFSHADARRVYESYRMRSSRDAGSCWRRSSTTRS
jgi:hypothetical protein